MFNYEDLKNLIREVLQEQELLTEGGAGGHMRHPFDLDDVKTGKDLYRKFEQIGNEIKAGNRPDTKIDGVNTSIKIIDGPEGKEYAMDRGSSKAIDVEGITVDRLPERFSPGHGMITAGENVLGIFNDALKDAEPELKELGVLDDPTKFFNMEYVKGTTNVLAYDHNFLKIHGINQFYEKKNRKGGQVRPGLERPIDPETNKPIKDPSVPVAYDQEVMDRLVEKLNKYADKYGFKVYSSIPSTSTGDFDFSSVMNVPVPVTYLTGDIREETLGDRLKAAKNRIGETVKTVDGRKPPAQGKEIYKAVLGASAADTNADPARQTPLDELLANEEDYQKAIDGAVFWHATRLLGNVIMNNMVVDHPAVKGPATDHEGLVIRLSGDDFDTKITGEFILGGEASSFRDEAPEAAKEVKAKNIAIFPGSFKPPHKGHLSVIERVAKNPEVDEIKVIISAPGKNVRSPKITPEKAKAVFEKFILAANISKPVSVEIASQPSPIGAAYEYIGEKAGPNENVLLLTSEADSKRYPQESLDKYAGMNKNAETLTVKGLVLPVCKDEGCETTGKISATTIRNIVDAYQEEITLEDLTTAIDHMPNSMSIEDKLTTFEMLVDDSLSDKFKVEDGKLFKVEDEAQIEEMSMVSGGGIGGYTAPIGRRKKQENRTIYNMRENLNHEESILKDYLVERYVEKFTNLLSEATDSATATGMTYVADAFNTTRANFEKRYNGLGEQDQRTSFLVNFLNKMVHGFIQQDIGEGITPVMPFDELVEKGIITLDIGKSGTQFVQSALEEQEVTLDIADEDEGLDLVPDEEGEAQAEKEKENAEKMKAGKVSPDVTDEPLPGTNETGNRAASSYYNLDSKNIFRFYNLIGPEDIDDREQFVEFYFKNIVALAAGIERSKTGSELPEPLNSMFNKLSGGGDVVKEPELESEPAPEAAATEAPALEDELSLQESVTEDDISTIIKQSVIKTFRDLQF